MSYLITLIILSLAVIFQTTILSRVTLLQGPADLVLLVIVGWILLDRDGHVWLWPVVGGLMMGIFSALPIWLPMISYLIVTALTLALKRRVWQVPILALFTSVFIGTVIIYSVSYIFLAIRGVSLDPLEAINVILLPSIILNLIISIPVQAVLKEISGWITPVDIEAEA